MFKKILKNSVKFKHQESTDYFGLHYHFFHSKINTSDRKFTEEKDFENFPKKTENRQKRQKYQRIPKKQKGGKFIK